MMRYVEQCQSLLAQLFPLEQAGTGEAPARLLNYLFLNTVSGVKVDADAAFDLWWNDGDDEEVPVRILSLLAACELAGRPCPRLRERFLHRIDSFLDAPVPSQLRTRLLEAATAVYQMEGDEERASGYAAARAKLPLHRFDEESGLEALYLISPASRRETAEAIAFAATRVGIGVVGGGPLRSVASLVLATAHHARRAGITTGELLTGAAQGLDRAVFADGDEERFILKPRAFDLVEEPIALAVDIDVTGTGTLVPGAHAFGAATWQLYQWVPTARRTAANDGMPKSEPLPVEVTLHLSDGVQAGEDLRLSIEGRAATVLALVAETTDANPVRTATVQLVRGDEE